MQGTPNGYPVSVSFGTGGSAGTPIVQSSPNVNYPTPFGIAITTIIATSSTAATASTVLIGTLYCVNTSASAATMLVTNTAGTSLVGGAAGFSIPANSDVTRNFFSGLLAVGIKWWNNKRFELRRDGMAVMWVYVQKTGTLKHVDEVVGVGYSGASVCKNDPSAQTRHNLGPIPCGLYKIGNPENTTDHGPMVLPLQPNIDNQMFGRSGFLIHGDSIVRPGEASEGCIIMDREIREQIAASPDRLLEVIAE